MRDNLTKKEIINSIYMQIGYSKKICEALIDDFFDILLENLIKNSEINRIKKVSPMLFPSLTNE